MSTDISQATGVAGKASSPEAGAGTVSRPMMGANAGSTPVPPLHSAEAKTRRTFRVRVISSRGNAFTDIVASNIYDAGCIALDRFPSAFCAEVIREIDANEPAILQRQAE